MKKAGKWIAGLSATAVLVAGAAVAAITFWPAAEKPAEAVPTVAPPRALTPFEEAKALLEAQAAGLEQGDEKTWLSAVDPEQPKLVARYRTLFRNLQGLGVGHVEYHASPEPESTKAEPVVFAQLGYCFTDGPCPAWRVTFDEGPPKLNQTVTFTLRSGRYVITGLAEPDGNVLPWESRQLSFATGKRVVVAAAGSQKKHLKTVLKAAEKAAVVTDRYAKMIGGVPAGRYRIYLADDEAWKTWYGGGKAKWVVGYARPLNAIGHDVVLHTRKVLDDDVDVIVQHELAHVVTLGGVGTWDTADDQWLLEGIAEYIGMLPKKAPDTYNRYRLQATAARKGLPKSIAVPTLDADADDLTVDTLYAMGHYAAACMATKYGEAKLMDFTDQVLRQGRKPDEASRSAFGKPFAAVDKTCMSWIRQRV
ncbi:hypothetical protein [Actinoplanes sp. NBRC 101535]|uniref:hypothetical protein n=1 Tax=Actinoplanes sp. NBRC 101535 TaxID=3032196 RepID=UPI0024A09593|nr:hypothetical protein [Actinoplanes sp. NBRC 101535]GLY05791.1 hypothetical protein Acsp01_61700 [Actinoplanes sp. NBRC 101535]